MTNGYGKPVNFYVGSTNTVEIDGVHLRKNENATTGVPSAYDDAATVVLETLTDTAGVAVTGSGVPVTLSYVTSSDGKYRGNFPDTTSLVVGTEYRGKVKVTMATGEIGRFYVQGKAIGAGA
jgi:hypothetical protein